MAISKVVYSGQTLIDLTGDTVSAETLAKNATAHDKAGNLIVGQMEAEVGGEYDAVSVSNGDGTQTLRITTVGSSSGGSDSGGDSSGSDMMVFVKSYTQSTVVSTVTDVQLISRGELHAAGLVGSTGTLCDMWEHVMIDMRSVSTPTHLNWQVIHAFATSDKNLFTPASDGNGYEVVTYHSSSPTYNLSDAMYRPITMATEGYLYEDGNVKYRAGSMYNLCPGEFEITVYVRGRK